MVLILQNKGSLGLNWQYVSIGSDKGLAPNRWQAIIYSNDNYVHQPQWV